MSSLGELKERLAADDAVLFAFLFGSRAKGAPRPDSDWDIGVYLEDRLTPAERFAFPMRLLAEERDPARLDIVVLNDAPPLLAQRALQGERILVKDAVAFVRFFVKTQAQAEDERFWRDLHASARAQRLEEGRFGRS